MMFKKLFIFLFTGTIQFCLSNDLQWNTKRPFTYTGFIYADSKIAVIDPVLQVLIKNGEEICNFQLNQTENNKKDVNWNPFRAVVKSAHMGLGEIELLPNINLKNFTNTKFELVIAAEACHHPETWSETATISIKVIVPPVPLWAKSPYRSSISDDAKTGTTVVKVMAFLPSWADPDNRICNYRIKDSLYSSLFAIDGFGTITTSENFLYIETGLITLEVIAEDCSLPVHRMSEVNVFITVNISCQFGWTGFYKGLNYESGSAIATLGKKPIFQFCQKEPNESFTGFIGKCQNEQKLRVTVSVELKSIPRSNMYANICNLDYGSLKLQRKVCDIDDKRILDLLTIMSKKKTGIMKFPRQTNIFPGLSLVSELKFSLYFWMHRNPLEQTSDTFIICHLDDIGNRLFSVSVSFCVLKIYLHLSHNKNMPLPSNRSQSLMWDYNLFQICDDKWHHYLIIIDNKIDNSQYPEIRVFVDAEIVEYNNRTSIARPFISTNPVIKKNNVFIGNCPRYSGNVFEGYLAGFIFLPKIILKSTNVRCLMKCMERLHFNGLNQMNPGMSVSLNSEMQTIIINGHNVEEVARLVEVIGYTNPSWSPIPGMRLISIQTEMTCERKTFNIPTINIVVNVSKQTKPLTNPYLITSINLLPKVNRFHLSNIRHFQSITATGLSIFENITLNVIGIYQSTMEKSEETSTISRCIISIHPELVQDKEYLEWPQQAINTLKTQSHSMEVVNNSKKIIFYAEYNKEIYQFILQHIRYFSSISPGFGMKSNKKFTLQCSTDVEMSIVNSNVAVVEVITDLHDEFSKTIAPISNVIEMTTVKNSLLKILMKSKEHGTEMRAYSDAARLYEIQNTLQNRKKLSKENSKGTKIYNYFLGIGIFILICSLFAMIRKIRKIQTKDGCVLSFKVVDCICFPLQSIKEKLKPSATVRVELSRDFLNRTLAKRRDVGLEMQWDDAEMKSGLKYHIIENLTYMKDDPEFDDNNNDVPPICEIEDLTTDDEIEEETSVEIDKTMLKNEKHFLKKRLIDL